MAYIESAFYGDEKSQRNATKVLSDKILGTTVDVDVNEQLIPPFEVAEKVSLDSKDEKNIRAQAVSQCGGVDQDCINKTEATLRQNTLAAKQQQSNSSANVIKGRRLTVNIIDENGARKRIVVPDGQKFKLDNVSVNDPLKGPYQAPSAEYIQTQLKTLGMLVLTTLAYVFSVAATYTVFMQTSGGIFFAVPATAVAIFLPYSGYALIFFYFMYQSAVNTYVGNL